MESLADTEENQHPVSFHPSIPMQSKKHSFIQTPLMRKESNTTQAMHMAREAFRKRQALVGHALSKTVKIKIC